MSAASYNRGSRAISEHITQQSRDRAMGKPWEFPLACEIHFTSALIAVLDNGVMIHREFIPFGCTVDYARLSKAVNRAYDPNLRGICPDYGGHAANAWQLHYPRA